MKNAPTVPGPVTVTNKKLERFGQAGHISAIDKEEGTVTVKFDLDSVEETLTPDDLQEIR